MAEERRAVRWYGVYRCGCVSPRHKHRGDVGAYCFTHQRYVVHTRRVMVTLSEEGDHDPSVATPPSGPSNPTDPSPA